MINHRPSICELQCGMVVTFKLGKFLELDLSPLSNAHILDVLHLRPTIEYFWASSGDFQGGKVFGTSSGLT